MALEQDFRIDGGSTSNRNEVILPSEQAADVDVATNGCAEHPEDDVQGRCAYKYEEFLENLLQLRYKPPSKVVRPPKRINAFFVPTNQTPFRKKTDQEGDNDQPDIEHENPDHHEQKACID